MMTQDTGQHSQPPKSKKGIALKILLISSLTLNVVIIGLVVGALYSFKRHDGPGIAGDRFTAPFVRALSFEDKRAVGRDIRRNFRSASVDRQADHARYLEALALLRQTPFDDVALKSTIIALDKAGIDRRALARESFLSRISEMSDAERAAYADRLEEELKHGHKSRNGKKPHGGKDRP